MVKKRIDFIKKVRLNKGKLIKIQSGGGVVSSRQHAHSLKFRARPIKRQRYRLSWMNELVGWWLLLMWNCVVFYLRSFSKFEKYELWCRVFKWMISYFQKIPIGEISGIFMGWGNFIHIFSHFTIVCGVSIYVIYSPFPFSVANFSSEYIERNFVTTTKCK